MLNDITAMVRNHNLVLPSDIALFIKAIITLEGFGRLLNPDFDLMTEAEPLLKRMIRTRYSPARLAKSLSLRALDVVDKVYAPPPVPGQQSPQEQGLDPRQLERMVTRLERGQYRQVQALLVASSFIGGSVMLAGKVGPSPWGISLFGLIVFLGSAGWASWLMWVSRRFLREWE